jgi:hypothetical protein
LLTATKEYVSIDRVLQPSGFTERKPIAEQRHLLQPVQDVSGNPMVSGVTRSVPLVIRKIGRDPTEHGATFNGGG